jgi:hypothetical protein
MAQTIWLHKLSETTKQEAEGMEYVCEHLFQSLTQTGKLVKIKGWNPVPNATAKDGSAYRALFCDGCGKNYTSGHIRLGKESKETKETKETKEPVLV